MRFSNFLDYHIRPEDVAAFEAGTLDVRENPEYQNDVCSICRDVILPGHETALIVPCRHGFHRECLARHQADTCPNCRGSRGVSLGPDRILYEVEFERLAVLFPNISLFSVNRFPHRNVEILNNRPFFHLSWSIQNFVVIMSVSFQYHLQINSNTEEILVIKMLEMPSSAERADVVRQDSLKLPVQRVVEEMRVAQEQFNLLKHVYFTFGGADSDNDNVLRIFLRRNLKKTVQNLIKLRNP